MNNRYQRKLAEFESSLKFPVKLAKIKKFLKKNEDYSENQSFSNQLFKNIEEQNYFALLELFTSTYHSKISANLSIQAPNLFKLVPKFESDLKENENLIKYIESHEILLKLSEKLTVRYFKILLKKIKIPEIQEIFEKIKENVKVSILNSSFTDFQTIAFYRFENEILEEFRVIFSSFAYVFPVEKVLLNVFKKTCIVEARIKFEEFIAECISEVLDMRDPNEIIENLKNRWNFISELEKIKFFLVSVIKAAKILKIFKEDQKSYSSKRAEILLNIKEKKLFKDSNNFLLKFWRKRPSNFLLFIERCLLKKYPFVKAKKMILKIVNNEEKPLIDSQLKKTQKKLKEIPKIILKKLKNFMKTYENTVYFTSILEDLNLFILSELKPLCNPSFFIKLSKSSSLYMSKTLNKLLPKLETNQNITKTFSGLKTMNKSPSLQKLIIIPNTFDRNSLKPLEKFASNLHETESLIYYWKPEPLKVPERTILNISTLFCNNSLKLFTYGCKAAYDFSSSYSSFGKINQEITHSGETLAEIIKNSYQNCSINLMVFGVALEVAGICLKKLGKLEMPVVDNLIILSQQEIPVDFQQSVTGKIFNVHLAQVSYTAKLQKYVSCLSKNYGSDGDYREKCVNVEVNEFDGVDLDKVLELVQIRE